MAPCMYQNRVHLYIVVHSLAQLLGYGMLYLSVLERQFPWTVLGCTDQFRIGDGRFSDSTKACLKIMMAGVNNSEF